MISISLCMIVKNEEQVLARCLDSLQGLMDEIIIVDTGSTDKTKEIAARYTNQVYDFAWVDDFSAARNFAFSKATCDYIYSADADEVLDEENYERFQTLKKVCDPAIEIVQMYYGNQLHNGSVYNFNQEYRPKLFKRIRSFTWIDPVHETVRTSPLVFNSDIIITHQQEESHANRDLYIFERTLKESGVLSDRLWEMYLRELYMAGADENLETAIPYLVSRCETTSDELECKRILAVLARGYRLLGQKEKFFQYSLRGVALGASAELCCEIGEYYHREGNGAEAQMWFYNSIHETESLLDIRSSRTKE